jgi:hypothetical protein
MQPLFAVQPFGIFAHEQIVAPLRIRQGIGIQRPRNMRLAAAAKFTFGARAAPGAGNFQHVSCCSMFLNTGFGLKSGSGFGRLAELLSFASPKESSQAPSH